MFLRTGKNENQISIQPLKRGKEENPENYRPRLGLGKVMEQIILETISNDMKDTKVIRGSQHRFMKGKSCLTNIIAFYDEKTGLVDDGRAVGVIYLNTSAVSHDNLIEKQMKYRLYILYLQENAMKKRYSCCSAGLAAPSLLWLEEDMKIL